MGGQEQRTKVESHVTWLTSALLLAELIVSLVSHFFKPHASLVVLMKCFTEQPTTLFGEKLKDQVEERLKFYETGEAPRKNTVVMEEAISELKRLQEEVTPSSEKKKKKKKEKKVKMEEE